MSPFSRFQGMREADPLALFVPWAEKIVKSQPKLAYVHAVGGRAEGNSDIPEHLRKAEDTLSPIRKAVEAAGVSFMVAGGYLPEMAIEHATETEDLIAFGRYFICAFADMLSPSSIQLSPANWLAPSANPDLPERIKNGWPLEKYNRATFYIQSEEGFTE